MLFLAVIYSHTVSSFSRLWREPSARTRPCLCAQRLSFLMESWIQLRKYPRSEVNYFPMTDLLKWKQRSRISDTFPRCVPAGCALQTPTACGCLSGRFSHCLHGQGWLPTRPVWLQVKRCYQHFCRYPQGKEWLFIPLKSFKLNYSVLTSFFPRP